ncbi:hypothetical protein NEOC95_000987 [Neochlamydia sp. AcF95]|nr:hypothetical protein [Neochlamydia sp. AcF95]
MITMDLSPFATFFNQLSLSFNRTSLHLKRGFGCLGI